MSEILVEALDARRVYAINGREVVALERATCRVRAGETIALLGPSGSGKSTLLHLMGALDAPSSGLVRFPALGKPHSLRPGKVAFAFQAQSLMASLTALENTALPLVLGGMNQPEAKRLALEVLGTLDLLHVTDQLPEELSGGQAQRIAVARAIAGTPRLILADEPTGQLDTATALAVIGALLARVESTGAALVVATHDEDIAKRLGTTWRMHHGVLETQILQVEMVVTA